MSDEGRDHEMIEAAEDNHQIDCSVQDQDISEGQLESKSEPDVEMQADEETKHQHESQKGQQKNPE